MVCVVISRFADTRRPTAPRLNALTPASTLITRAEPRKILELSRRPGQALSRQQLLRLVWEHDYLGDSRLVDACVQRLRAKVEDVPSSPKLIRTVRGVGYRLDAPA